MLFSLIVDGNPTLGWVDELGALEARFAELLAPPVPAALPDQQADRFAAFRNHPELTGPAAQARQARTMARIGA